MEQINPQEIRELLQQTLTGFAERKIKSDDTALSKAIANSEHEKILELQEKINKTEKSYNLDIWINDSLPFMLKGLKFGTHLSKGIHSSSTGDNIYFKPIAEIQEEYLAGTHTLESPQLDANGNAAALPLATFLETQIGTTTLQELILTCMTPLFRNTF